MVIVMKKHLSEDRTSMESILGELSKYRYYDEISTALATAEQAGVVLRNSFGRENKIKHASRRDIKIEEDILSEKIIIDQLTRFQYPIISEEIGNIGDIVSGLPTWIVDPLDGTHNFMRNIPICAISIALWMDKKPLFGVVYNFLANEIFVGISEIGAWRNGHQIEVSVIDTLSDASIATGFPVNTDFSSDSIGKVINHVRRFKKIRMLGSAAMSLAYVASGRVDIYQEEHIMIWDIAGGLALVEAAGGAYILLSTEIENCYTVIAGNSAIVKRYE